MYKVSIWYIEPCPLFGGYFYCSECPLSEVPLYREVYIWDTKACPLYSDLRLFLLRPL